MCFTTLLLLMMERDMIGQSYVCAGFPAISSRSLSLNIVTKAMVKG